MWGEHGIAGEREGLGLGAQAPRGTKRWAVPTRPAVPGPRGGAPDSSPPQALYDRLLSPPSPKRGPGQIDGGGKGSPWRALTSESQRRVEATDVVNGVPGSDQATRALAARPRGGGADGAGPRAGRARVLNRAAVGAAPAGCPCARPWCGWVARVRLLSRRRRQASGWP